MITRNDYSSLTGKLNAIFVETSAAAIAESEGMKFFGVKETDWFTYDHRILHGLAGIEEVADGADLPRVNSDEGDTASVSQRYFGAIVSITKGIRKFDRYDKAEDLVRSITDDAWDGIDQSFADVLTFGWSTSYTDVWGASVTSTGPDGESLFNSAHSNGTSSTTYSNLINDGTNNNPTLSRAAVVESRSLSLVYKDPEGKVRPIKLDTLLVPANLEDLAERIILSNQMSGVADNDINPLKGKIKNIVVWPRLDTRTGGTDTSNYYFLYDSRKVKESLQALFAERPELDPPEEVYENKNWDYSIDFYYNILHGFPAYIRGSNASA